MNLELHSISLHLARAEGALERTLGLIRRRGHAIESFSAMPVPSGWLVSATFTTNRAVQPLIRQLEKLVEVRAVTLTSPAALAECVP